LKYTSIKHFDNQFEVFCTRNHTTQFTPQFAAVAAGFTLPLQLHPMFYPRSQSKFIVFMIVLEGLSAGGFYELILLRWY